MRPIQTVYRGIMAKDGGLVVEVNGAMLRERLDLRNHSPTGFAHGYGGSGPAQLALAILADFLEDDLEALALYQPFKWRIIAQLPVGRNWELTGQQIADVIAVLKQEARDGA